ncbi:MAG TPA: beta-propeller fold lactonase family protein [Terracidiphilus sp.]|nr:beta-propeller fold lactonase family protein [Terracidiphilus sp.]
MKFSKLSQLFLVSTIGLLVATLLTSCEITTIDYVFVASSQGSGTGSPGQIETYDADSQTGALRTGTPAVNSGGSNPVAMAVTSDYQNLYVANQGNSSVVHFAIASNGVLTQKDTVTATSMPVALAVNTAGTYLYVVSCVPTSSTALTCAGAATLSAYSLSSGTIGSKVLQQTLSLSGISSAYASDVLVPTGVTVLANNSTVSGNAVFVTAYDQSAYNPGGTTTSTANPGWVFSFTVGSGGALTPAMGSPYMAGVKPTAIIADPTDRFVYVTDYASNELIGYTIQDGSTLDFMVNGPFRTGNEPQALVVDPRGLYIYVANALDSSVSAYNITLATGAPSTVVNVIGSAVNSTDTTPVAILVDAAVGRFVYTADYQGNSISGFKLSADTGSLAPTQATPYPTGFQPTALVSVPHGNHALQTVTP